MIFVWKVLLTGCKKIICNIFKVTVSARKQDRMIYTLFSWKCSTKIIFFHKMFQIIKSWFRNETKTFISTYLCLIVLSVFKILQLDIIILTTGYCRRYNYFNNYALLLKTECFASQSICGLARDGHEILGFLLVFELSFSNIFLPFFKFFSIYITLLFLQFL